MTIARIISQCCEDDCDDDFDCKECISGCPEELCVTLDPGGALGYSAGALSYGFEGPMTFKKSNYHSYYNDLYSGNYPATSPGKFIDGKFHPSTGPWGGSMYKSVRHANGRTLTNRPRGDSQGDAYSWLYLNADGKWQISPYIYCDWDVPWSIDYSLPNMPYCWGDDQNRSICTVKESKSDCPMGDDWEFGSITETPCEVIPPPCEPSTEIESVSVNIRAWFTGLSNNRLSESWFNDPEEHYSGDFAVLEPSPADWGYTYAVPWYSASGVLRGTKNSIGQVWNYGNEAGQWTGIEKFHSGSFGSPLTTATNANYGPVLRWQNDTQGYLLSNYSFPFGYSKNCDDPRFSRTSDITYYYYTVAIT